jgi:hypothetical protein
MATSYTVSAQNASRIYIEPNGWSIGTDIGMSDMWADVGTKSMMDHYGNSHYLDKVAFVGGMFGRYTVHPCFALRYMLNYGTLYATDKWNEDKAKVAPTQGDDAFQRYARNQTAKTIIFENSLLMEFTPGRMNPESKSAHRRGQFYVAAGLTYLHFENYSTIGASSQWVKTYDLHLEGQGFGQGYPPDYNRWTMAAPMALGYRWDIGQHLNLGIEFMYRMTFTDYLDGVSGKYISPVEYQLHLSPKDANIAYQVADKEVYSGYGSPNIPGNKRGNASNNDSYSTLTITFYYKVFSATHEWWH